MRMGENKEIEAGNGSRKLSINNLFPNISNGRKRKFLIAYASSGKIRQASRDSWVDWTYHYKWMKEDEEYN